MLGNEIPINGSDWRRWGRAAQRGGVIREGEGRERCPKRQTERLATQRDREKGVARTSHWMLAAGILQCAHSSNYAIQRSRDKDVQDGAVQLCPDNKATRSRRYLAGSS